MLTSSLALIWTFKMGVSSPKQNLFVVFNTIFQIFMDFCKIFLKQNKRHTQHTNTRHKRVSFSHTPYLKYAMSSLHPNKAKRENEKGNSLDKAFEARKNGELLTSAHGEGKVEHFVELLERWSSPLARLTS